MQSTTSQGTVKLRINVTKNDIMHGERGNCHQCPIALAIKRRIKDSYYPIVIFSCPRLQSDHEGYVDEIPIKLPQSARRFMYAFDAYNFAKDSAVRPFSFKIEVPKSVLKEKK